MNRRWEFDALRGLMLVLMTCTHLPTRWSSPLGQPFGFVSAAEGFVLLSGFMAGMVYTGRALKRGLPEMRSAFLKRALKIYACQLALLLFLLTVVAGIGWATNEPAIANMVGWWREHPLTAWLGGLALLYSPPLLDILPMYILFMLASPVLLLHGLRQGWGPVLAVSVALWLASQFKLGAALYDAIVGATGLPVPLQQTGAFDILAWQFLWVLGLWLGATLAAGRMTPIVFPRWMLNTAIVIATIGFVWRHAVGQSPLPGQPALEILFDKWQLAPLRMLNFFALMVLVIHHAEPLKRIVKRRPLLEMLGSASLPVFCAHLVLALTALALFGEPKPERPLLLDASIFGGSFAVLLAVAWVSSELDRRTAALRGRIAERRDARREAREHDRTAGRPTVDLQPSRGA